MAKQSSCYTSYNTTLISDYEGRRFTASQDLGWKSCDTFFWTKILSRRKSSTLDILIAYRAFSCHPNVQRPFLAAPVEIDWQVVVDLPHHHRQPWSWTCAVSIRSISPLSPQPAKTSDGRAGEGRLARGTEVLGELYSHWATFAEVKYQPVQTVMQDLFVSLLLPCIHTQMHSKKTGGRTVVKFAGEILQELDSPAAVCRGTTDQVA